VVTGRVAKPLQDYNLKVVGVDISRGMIQRAREKKIERLILGDASHLLVRARSVDAAIFAHVLHIFEDPVMIFRSVTGVVTKEIVALVRKQQDRELFGGGNGLMWQALQEAAAKVGYTFAIRAGEWRRKERELLASILPTELINFQDELIETSINDRLSYVEKRAFRRTLDIPDNVLEKMMREVQSSLSIEAAERKIQYRRTEQIAIWRLN
jgi:SAM-dependent methyltransferase